MVETLAWMRNVHDQAEGEVIKKITAIEGGGDWVDASVEYLVLPDGMDVEKEHGIYLNREGKWISFTDWLKSRGARETTEEELEVFYDGP